MSIAITGCGNNRHCGGVIGDNFQKGDVVAIETPIECVDEFDGLRCCREATGLIIVALI